MKRQFPFAAQPDIVLASQKDSYYRREFREQVVESADVIFSPQVSVAAQPELKFLAELAYFSLTTLRSKQTLGEEYCDIFQTLQKGNSFIGSRTRLFLFAIVAPYLSKRLQLGGWKPLFSLFQPPLSARERAELLRKQMLARQQQSSRASSDQVDNKESYFSYLVSNRSSLQFLLSWSSFFYRLHLAVFYLRGEFYEWSKRIAGVRYSFTREPQSQRASYRILGWFLLVQLVTESASSIQATCRSIGRAWGLVHDKVAEKGMVKTVVPCVASEEEEEGEGLTALAASERHERGMDGVKCGICLSSIKNASCTPCGHLFCYQHIVEAVAVRRECPLCRQSSDPSDVACVYFTL